MLLNNMNYSDLIFSPSPSLIYFHICLFDFLAQQKFYLNFLEVWATERRDEKILIKKEIENQLQLNLSNQVKMRKDIKINERNEIKKKILEKDLLISRNVLQIMEISGTIRRRDSNVGKNVFI